MTRRLQLRLAAAVMIAACAARVGTAHAGISGTVDPSFGGQSGVVTDFGHDAQANAVAIQPDGNIVVVGYAVNAAGDRDFALARYDYQTDATAHTTAGGLDPGFNNGQVIVTDVSKSITGTGANDEANGVVIQPDGAIVVVGYTTINGVKQFAAARYTSSGTLDITFGTGGIVHAPIASGDATAYAAALQRSGDIVLAGAASNGSDHDFALLALDTAGTPDDAFGGNGIGIASINLGPQYDDFAQAIAVQPDDTLVVAGYSIVPTPTFGNPAATANRPSIVRYRSNGTQDTSFTSGTLDLGTQDDESDAVVIRPTGDIVAAGPHKSSTSTGYDFRLLGYSSSGIVGNPMITNFSGGRDWAFTLALQPDGRLIAAGYATLGANTVFALARYTVDDNGNINIDAGFGPNGDGTTTLSVSSTDNSEIRAIALQPDGKIVAAGDADLGSGYRGFAVARFYATDTGGPWGLKPDNLAFQNDTAAAAGAADASAPVTVAGLDSGMMVPVTVSGDGTNNNSSAQCIKVLLPCTLNTGFTWAQNGDEFTVTHTVPAGHGQQTTTHLSAGGLVAANNDSVVLDLGTVTTGSFTSTVNQAPVITGTPATTVEQDTAYAFQPATASDPDQDSIHFSISNKPTWAAFDPATGALTGTPTSVDVGTNPGIVIAAVDNYGAATALPAFTLTVTAPPAPPAPSGGGGGTIAPAALAALALRLAALIKKQYSRKDRQEREGLSYDSRSIASP